MKKIVTQSFLFLNSLAFLTVSTAARAGQPVAQTRAYDKKTYLKANLKADYDRIKRIYQKSGLQAAIAASSVNISSEDEKFLKTNVRGVHSMPDMRILDAKTFELVPAVEGSAPMLRIQIKSFETGEVDVNGRSFKSLGSIEKNYVFVQKVLEEDNKKTSWSPMDVVVPKAHAGGVAIAIAAIAIGGGYLLYKWGESNGEKNAGGGGDGDKNEEKKDH